MAIVWAVKYFRPYLFGRKFTIVTDHKPLQWLMNLKEPSSRLTRWKLKLSEYNYKVVYKKGKANTNADALSRVEIYNEESPSLIVNISDSESTVTAPDERPIISDSSTDTAPSLRALSSPTPDLDMHDSETIHTSQENPILEVPISEEPLNKFRRQLVIKCTTRSLKDKPKITVPFENFRRTVVEVSENNLEEEIVSIVQKFIEPKLRTAILVQPVEKNVYYCSCNSAKPEKLCS